MVTRPFSRVGCSAGAWRSRRGPHAQARIHGKFVNQTAGFHVVAHAQTGAEARRAVDENHPDLILLDVHLPDSNGLDLLHELRAARVPVGVIVITAAREANSVRAAVEAGRPTTSLSRSNTAIWSPRWDVSRSVTTV